ncbi:MAG: riboflavin synthase [Segetibacter sp.]
MFTGIIEALGSVETIDRQGSNTTFWIRSNISADLKIDQSVSHNGVCLTVDEVKDNLHRVTAISETLSKTNLTTWQPDTLVNLERCLAMNARLDGHIVQGHVDSTATCINKNDLNGSWEYTFQFDPKFGSLVIEKGSISLNGVSLTIFNVTENTFTVAIIPFTFNHTNIHQVKEDSIVNIEFDIIGKYINRLQSLKNNSII